MADEKVLQNLRRIEGQIKGLQKMITDERECEEILTQIMAVKAALDRVTTDLAEVHLDACLSSASPEDLKRKMAKTIRLLCKM